MKYFEFLHIASLINQILDTTPLLFGSLGLEKRLNKNLDADDIDVLIPEMILNKSWNRLIDMMKKDGHPRGSLRGVRLLAARSSPPPLPDRPRGGRARHRRGRRSPRRRRTPSARPAMLSRNGASFCGQPRSPVPPDSARARPGRFAAGGGVW